MPVPWVHICWQGGLYGVYAYAKVLLYPLHGNTKDKFLYSAIIKDLGNNTIQIIKGTNLSNQYFTATKNEFLNIAMTVTVNNTDNPYINYLAVVQNCSLYSDNPGKYFCS